MHLLITLNLRDQMPLRFTGDGGYLGKKLFAFGDQICICSQSRYMNNAGLHA